MSNNQKRGSDDKPANTHRHRNETDSSSTDPNPNEGPNSSTLASRIQNSASGLARNAFAAPGLSADTAELLAGSGKAGPSSSPSALAAAQQHYQETSISASPSTRDRSIHTPAETFRSTSTVQRSGGFELPPLTEDEFQRTGSFNNNNSDLVDLDPQGEGKGKGKETTGDLYQKEPSNLTSSQDQRSLLPSEPSLVPSDGSAVLSLLSDRTFDPEFPPSAHEPPEIMLDSFRRLIPPEQTQNQTSPPHKLTSLSLVPDIGTFLDTVPSGAVTNSDVASLRDAVLTGLPGGADWVAVEERYHDEVWGYLRPTLEAAAKEMESNRDSRGEEEGPAVRRLKMILKHMQH
ncbi:hypothetical protein BO70DRAFT_393758 [Aspergillus heteromorphus CBS 117.55]|uniref:Uncharacterized protein n=1 Tax=Aspergillus heteromorphus CBS 117.55 TaxID=1448321 RepID=A0A317WS25_9EURO|nr:uncharacterized protein BO70DRAFT_393758 [Aspergillus heteromorphus CBS 117.55]PWY89254.1 hypothetical protein BO70DRAFT_393758 [Aspergillus heteromorphus CBS 117.55]